MSWFTELFSSGASSLLDSAGKIIDEFVTSGEEKLEARNKLEKIVNEFKTKTMDAAGQLDKEITDRLRIDMQSDSWLSKNIRPMGLLFMLFTTVTLVYMTTFGDLTPLQVDVLKSWMPLVINVLIAIIGFYYGSRGIEKFSKFKNK